MGKGLRFLGLLVIASAVVCGGCSDDDNPSSSSPSHFADEQWSNADIVKGGLLYDKWWTVNGSDQPTTDFDPIWASQSTNTRSGGDTWRCKECHGWDYVGELGRYSSGSHYTGFDGVWAARTKDRTVIFDNIKNEGGDHDFSSALSDMDVLHLTKFIVDGLVDMSQYIDSKGSATGNAAAGQQLYADPCATCHGKDGKTFDFEDDPGVQGVGWLANDNPQEVLHKIRWGHPGSDMPSMVDRELTDDQIGDILAYAQTLPK
jgi:mono/diheme cytochrome c family protein